ncbi:hypothetical protein Lal_00002573, partial [Lupinus albus]
LPRARGGERRADGPPAGPRAVPPRGPGPDAAGRGRPVRLPPPARVEQPGADHHAHRQGRRVQPYPGPGTGADDYLAKPFNPRELLARIKAVLRRQAPQVPGAPAAADESVTFGEYELSLATRELKKGEDVHMLTTGEFAVLKALVQHAREPLTRDKLMNLARGREWDALERSIDVQISRLRRLIEPDPSKPRYIQTVWGVGYVFVPDGNKRLSLLPGKPDESAVLVPAEFLLPHPLAGAHRRAVFQGADPGLPDDERGRPRGPPVQPRRRADPACLLGGQRIRARRPGTRRRPQAGDQRRRAAQRAALALQRDLRAADADRARPRDRGAPARQEPAGALGAGPGAGPRLGAHPALSTPLARAAHLERARLVPRHRPAVHCRRLDLRAPAQRPAQAPGVRRPPARPGPQRAPAGERHAQRDDRGLPRLQPDGRGRRAGRPRARADAGRRLPRPAYPVDAVAPVPGADEQRQRVHRGHGSRHRGHGRHPRPVPRLHPRRSRRAPGRARPRRAGARGGGPLQPARGARAPVPGAGAAVPPAARVDQAPLDQPDRERAALWRQRRRSGRLRCGRSHRPLCRPQRARPWPGHRPGRAGRHLQPLHPRRPRPWRQGHRPGPGHRQAHRRAARRQRRAAQPFRRWAGSPRVPAPGPAAAPRRRLTAPHGGARVHPRRLPSGCDAGSPLAQLDLVVVTAVAAPRHLGLPGHPGFRRRRALVPALFPGAGGVPLVGPSGTARGLPQRRPERTALGPGLAPRAFLRPARDPQHRCRLAAFAAAALRCRPAGFRQPAALHAARRAGARDPGGHRRAGQPGAHRGDRPRGLGHRQPADVAGRQPHHPGGLPAAAHLPHPLVAPSTLGAGRLRAAGRVHAAPAPLALAGGAGHRLAAGDRGDAAVADPAPDRPGDAQPGPHPGVPRRPLRRRPGHRHRALAAAPAGAGRGPAVAGAAAHRAAPERAAADGLHPAGGADPQRPAPGTAPSRRDAAGPGHEQPGPRGQPARRDHRRRAPARLPAHLLQPRLPAHHRLQPP